MTAIGKGSDGADIAGTSNVSVKSVADGTVLLPTLSIYEVGLGSGTVTSSDGVISCITSAASGAACTGNYVLGGATVTLTATPADGSTFGGWSANCLLATPTSCSIVMNNNEPVGAIFNTSN
jgi:Divergent InlB B-repeat domain